MNPFTRLTFIVLVCLIALTWAIFPAAAKPAPGDFNGVDDYIAETMRRLPISGLSLAIVKGDQILYMQGYGRSNQAGDPVTPQTPFMLASVTKTFTALAVQQLAEAGSLDLDAPLQNYIPEFTLADQAKAAAITIRHLLDHTSGISELEGTQPYVHNPATTFEQALIHLQNCHPTSQPGQHYQYSNLNYILLGEVAARTSGQPYAEYVKTHILDPLQMSQASFDDYHTIPGAAAGSYISFGMRFPYDEKHIPLMLSAGYLTASAEDMAHYLVAFLNKGQYQGLSLLSPQGQGWYDAYWNWHPGFPADIAVGHSGGHNSFSTDFKLFVSHKVGVVVLMNTRLDTIVPAPDASQIAFNIGRLVMGLPHELPSNREFYTYYALYDGFLLLIGTSILWQGARLKGWAGQYQAASPRRRIFSWIGILFNLLAAAGIFMLPALNHTTWTVMLAHRSDIAAVFLSAGILLAALSLLKIAFVTLATPARLSPTG
jgi:CubicO group peptidase (beta-lactamase class C family)